MTFAEKFKKDHPNGTCSHVGCPSQLGYEIDLSCPRHTDDRPLTCDECWEREMPGTESTECAKLPTDEKDLNIVDPIIEEYKAKIAELEEKNKQLAIYNRDLVLCLQTVQTCYGITLPLPLRRMKI